MKKSLHLIPAILLLFSACQNNQNSSLDSDLKFVHTVFFWLNDTVTEEDRNAFEQGLLDLGKVQSIGKYEYGTPAGTPREVVDNSYDFAWIVYFTDEAAHDLYQEDPLHLEFIEKYRELWENVMVYDTVLE
jgi:hypothetical protein